MERIYFCFLKSNVYVEKLDIQVEALHRFCICAIAQNQYGRALSPRN